MQPVTTIHTEKTFKRLNIAYC